jgi:serine/threonine protein phosphatase PrpC
MAYVVNLGDSRVYRMRDSELRQLTIDHTYPNELLRMGVITADEVASHPQHHVLTRAIGAEGENVPDIEPYELQVGDVFMLCSDGITNHVNDEQIAEILATSSPSTAAWKLVGQALVGGGSDNATAMVVRVDALETLGP